MTNETVKKFQALLRDMRRGLPIYRYYGLIEQLIPDKEIRDYMTKREIFVKGKTKTSQGQDQYFLGVNGIILANSFEAEELANKTMKLTSQMRWLTWAILALTAVLVLKEFNFFALFS